MKQYVFRKSSATPPEVMEYLEEKTKNTSFPKLVEALVLKDIEGPVAQDNDQGVAVFEEGISKIEEALATQTERIEHLAEHLPSAFDEHDIKKAVLPLFRKLDEANSARAGDLKKHIDNALANNQADLDEKVLKRNVYVATLAALKQHEAETGFHDQLLKEVSSLQDIFAVELGLTAGEQLDVLGDIRSDLDALIEYLSSPATITPVQQPTAAVFVTETLSDSEEDKEPEPSVPAKTQADDEDAMSKALDLLYEEDENDESTDDEAYQNALDYLLSDDDDEEGDVNTAEKEKGDELESLAAILHANEEVAVTPLLSEKPPVIALSTAFDFADVLDNEDLVEVQSIAQQASSDSGKLDDQELDVLADLLGL